jgi:hypothetical protein
MIGIERNFPQFPWRGRQVQSSSRKTNMTAKTSVLLAGAGGNLGRMIAEALAATNEADLRLLIRPESKEKVADLADGGAVVHFGDLNDVASLKRAVEGVDVVVSVVQGGPETIVDGQLALLQASAAAGVRRFVPSDFSYDFFNLAQGENINSDWRRSFADASQQARGQTEVVHVLNGCFLDRNVLFGFLGAFDFSNGNLNIWGDGKELMDFTTYRDTASYTAAAAIDARPLPSRFNIAGDSLDAEGLAQAYTAGSGTPIKVRQLGTLDDLDNLIAERQAADPANLFGFLPLMYWRGMLNGKGKLGELANARYPGIKPLSVAEYVRAERL